MIGIVDYNAGNITSVERALKSLKIDYIRSGNADELQDCSKLIFPGVGDAAYAMKELENRKLDTFLKDWCLNNKALLGICLGSQIIFDWSEEGQTDCLGLIPGKIQHFYTINKSLQTQAYKVPQIGFNNLIKDNGECPILKDIPDNSDFYFVHSYVICPQDNSVIKAYAEYGIKVPAVIQKGNLFACQFHPEKSGKPGLKILENFCK